MPILFVNKERVDVASTVPGDTPLLWILRDSLNLTGTKYGCGIAQCGACTVHVEGQPVRACQLQLSAVKQGAEITTIEGLRTREGQALQAAWQKLDVPDHVRGSAAGEKEAAHGCRHRRRDGRQPLPLRNVRAHSRRDPGGRPQPGLNPPCPICIAFHVHAQSATSAVAAS